MIFNLSAAQIARNLGETRDFRDRYTRIPGSFYLYWTITTVLDLQYTIGKD